MSKGTKILSLGAASELAAEIVRLRAKLIDADICPATPEHWQEQVGEQEWTHRSDCPCNGTGKMPLCGGRIAWVMVPDRADREGEPTDDHCECVACKARYDR